MKIHKLLCFIIFLPLFVHAQEQTVEEIKAINSEVQKRCHFDDYYDKAYIVFKEQFEKTSGISRAIWYHNAAELLFNYYTKNKYIIDKRTPVASEKKTDFKSWDRYTLFNIIGNYHLKVIEQKELLIAATVEEYKILFDTISDKSYRPSLYDAFAQSALYFFMYAEKASSQSSPYIIDSSYFSGNKPFLNIQLNPTDSFYFQYLSLSLFQDLTAIHLQDKAPLVLIDITLNRLNYMKNSFADTLSDYLYENALLELAEKYNYDPDICYQLGLFYHSKASFYDSKGQSHPQWNYQTAIEWLQKSINPNRSVSYNAKRLLASIQEKTVNITLQETMPALQPNLIEITYRNCDSLFIRIIPVSPVDYYNDWHYGTWQEPVYDSLVKKEYLFQWEYAFMDSHDHLVHKGELILPPLPSGNYILWFSPNNFKKEDGEGYNITFVQISNIAYSKRKKEGKSQLLVYDRMTGKPLKKAKLQVNYLSYWKNNLRYKQRRKSNEKGLITFRPPFWDAYFYTKVLLKFKNSTDTLLDLKNPQFPHHYSREWYWPFLEDQKQTSIITDRAIYRPGQTIHFKAIRVRRAKNSTRALPGRFVKMTLNGNGSDIAHLKLKTNNFGSCSGSFEIPADIKTGTYTIKNTYWTANAYEPALSIRIEEYKRPQFEIKIDEPEEAYKLNEKVEIKGHAKAFSGYPVDGAQVTYEIRRNRSTPVTYSSNTGKVVAYGETTTDPTGSFSFSFIAESDKNDKEICAYNFEITVKSIDISGETQETRSILYVAPKALNIRLEIPDVISKEECFGHFPLSVVNANGAPVATDVQYKITALKAPDNYLIQCSGITGNLTDVELLKHTFPYRDFERKSEKDNWEEVSVIYSGIFKNGIDSLFFIPQFSTLSEGYYKITLDATDQFNEEVKETIYFFLYDTETKECKAYLPVFLKTDKKAATVGDTVTVILGSYYDNAHIFLEIFTGKNKLIKSEWVTLNKEKNIYKIPITRKLKEGIIISAFCHKHNHMDHRSVTVKVSDPRSSDWIEVKSASFKDKVVPGQEEEWHIQLENVNGKKTTAEALATMYDASLDQFTPSVFVNRTWAWGKPRKLSASLFETDMNYYSVINFKRYKQASFSLSVRFYPSLEWGLYNQLGYYYSATGLSGEEVARMPGRSITVAYESPVFDTDMSMPSIFGTSGTEVRANYSFRVGGAGNHIHKTSMPGETAIESFGRPEEVSGFPVSIRKNFDETAFFYPHIKAGKEGNVSFNFKTTESLTRWNFQFFAHTKRGEVGYHTHKIIAQKKLMVVPNAPRFFREGDTINFAAKVVTLAEETMTGNVSVEFTDALTGESLPILLRDPDIPFIIKKGASFDASYKIAIPSGTGAITYTIRAMTEKFSDGEQKTIPVLSNRILITESIPLYVNSHDTNHFSFPNLKNSTSATLENFRYTLDFTSNPLWYAIQSLPYLMQYPYECNEQVFSRMYANSIGLHILNLSPQLKALFEKWESLPEEKLMSNLEKNPELKSVILEESPWLFDVREQQLNRQRLGMLFNLRKMSRQQANASDKLERRQHNNGSWAWFPGGEENYFITQHIVAGAGHLKSMGIDIPISRNTLSKAISYLDQEIPERYREWQLFSSIYNLREINSLPKIAFHYLYARSYFTDDYPLHEKDTFYREFIQKAKETWQNESIYMQAMTALVLYRNGDREIASTIVQSIKEKAQYSDELGMFWKKEGTGFSWYEAPIARQVALIEAFDIILKDHGSVEKMQRWLLKQRQNQNWGSTKATAEACYALLLRGKDPGFKEPDIAIHIGNHQIDLSGHPDAEPGSGYYKTAWDGNEITSDMADITVANHAKGSAWGGVYWQYFEETHQIKSAQTSLEIEKELYKITLNEQGKFLTKITDENPLNVGDKVMVKIIINTDRDMEYVHLKDMRAAAFEPANVLSGYKYQGGLRYYESTRDVATNFFIDLLPKGNYVIEYELIVSQTGSFHNGIATIQCMYAPEFSAHSEGIKVTVNSR